MCRVLVIPRTVFKALTSDFPISTRQIMTNLVERAEQVGRGVCVCDGVGAHDSIGSVGVWALFMGRGADVH